MEVDVSSKKQAEVLNEQESKIDREHERILNEIETTDTAFIGASLRAVYEGNDHEKFLERLDNRIKQHDRDIEKMCNFHYHGFIESITELINVRSDAERLKNQAVLINKDLQESGKEIARKNDDLIQSQLQQCNVASAIEKLSVCLPVLQMYTKICELMQVGRYYSALKTLEQLEHTYLPRIHSYRFCEIMLGNIPKIREEIKEVSMSKLKDFLESVRKNSAKIGMVAMKQVEKERNLEELPLNKKAEIPLSPEPPKTNISPIKRDRNLAKKKAKAPRPPQSKVPPQNHQRLNPFDEMSEDEEVNTRNPFDDSNPFTQDNVESNPFLNGPSNSIQNHSVNPFMTNPEETEIINEANPFMTMNGTTDTQATAVQNNVFTDAPEDANNEGSSAALKSAVVDPCNYMIENLPTSKIDFSDGVWNNVEVEESSGYKKNNVKDLSSVVVPNDLPLSKNIVPLPTVDSSVNAFISASTSNTAVQYELNGNVGISAASEIDALPEIPLRAPPRRKKKKKISLPVTKTNSTLLIKNDFPLTDNEKSDLEQSQSNNQVQPSNKNQRSSISINQLSNVSTRIENHVEFNAIVDQFTLDHNQDRPSYSVACISSSEKRKPIPLLLDITTTTASPNANRKISSRLKENKNDTILVSNYKIPLIDKDVAASYSEFVKVPAKDPGNLVESLSELPYITSAFEDDPKQRWRKRRPSNTIQIFYDLSASDLVDFSPVYKCLHIFGLLGSRPQFETYYRQQRRQQARIALEPPTAMQDNLEAYAHYFHEIVGFFVVEDHILLTAPNLISRQFIDDLWEMTISKLVTVLRTDSNYASDAAVMMKVKNLIVVFADTLKAYGFTVNRLFSLLMDMRDQYGEILLKGWAKIFNRIFDEDNYTAMLIETEAGSQELLATFPYEDPTFEHSVFPRKLPFSRFVPRIYNEIKNFILACLKYCEDLHLSSTEVDDMVRKSTNLLLTRTLASGFEMLVEKPSLGLTELVQIIINTKHLESSCRHIEDFVHSITGVKVNSAHSAKLVGVSTFRDARSRTEAQIYSKLNSKIDEFFELADYVWTLKEPQGTASRYLKDLIAFLQHNFEVFTNLPPQVAQTACMSACRHISARLTELLLDPQVKIITMAALQQFNLDLIQCEAFSDSEPVPGFRDGALQMSFVELRQLLDLFLSWDWSSYLADYGSGSSKYLRVNPATALILLEKIKEERGHRNIFTSLSKQEREKKKLLETVVRQLRSLLNETGPNWFEPDEDGLGSAV